MSQKKKKHCTIGVQDAPDYAETGRQVYYKTEKLTFIPKPRVNEINFNLNLTTILKSYDIKLILAVEKIRNNNESLRLFGKTYT